MNWIKTIIWPIHQVHQMSLDIHLWKLLYKSQFSCISWPNFWNICFEDFFTDLNSLSILHLLFFLTLSISAFSKIWVLVKNGCFATTSFSLQGSKFLKTVLLLQVLNLDIFSIAFFIIRWSLRSSFDISKIDIPSLNNFVIFCFSAVVRSFALPMLQYILWTKRINSFIRFQRS